MSLTIQQAAQYSLGLMDLTSLNDTDTDADIIALCQQSSCSAGHTAAICIYPQFIPLAKKTLASLNNTGVKVATVTNFPHGNDDVAQAVQETQRAVELGADEIDVVFPYKALKDGNSQIGYDLVSACKKACDDKVTLKVIIESGELESEQLIELASDISIRAGADFIKTSTGKVSVNATLSAAKIMLNVIKEHGANVGFKAAGGVRTVSDAKDYLELCHAILGEKWLSTQHFRFGASGLLSDVLKQLDITSNQVAGDY